MLYACMNQVYRYLLLLLLSLLLILLRSNEIINIVVKHSDYSTGIFTLLTAF